MTLKNPTTTDTQSSGDEAPQGLKLLRTLRGHTDTIGRIAWSPDGRMLASKSMDNTARVWDAETGDVLSVFKTEGADAVTALSVAWSPDGKILAVPSIDEVKLYDVWDGNTLGKYKFKGDFIRNLAWSPDGKIIAFGHNATVRLWNMKAGKVFQNIDLGNIALGLAWSPDGQMLAIGSFQVIRLWSAQKAKFRTALPTPGKQACRGSTLVPNMRRSESKSS